MIVIPQIITPNYVRRHPDWIFIYGNNLKDIGEEGHRQHFRQFKNCYAVPTKNSPCHRQDSFFSDEEFLRYKEIIYQAIGRIPWERRITILIQGIGKEEDESLLYRKAPTLYRYLIDDELALIKSSYDIDWNTPVTQ